MYVLPLSQHALILFQAFFGFLRRLFGLSLPVVLVFILGTLDLIFIILIVLVLFFLLLLFYDIFR